MKILVEIEIDCAKDEDKKAVLAGYFKSHTSGRKVHGFKIIEDNQANIIDADFEEISEEAQAVQKAGEEANAIYEKAKALVSSKSYLELKAFKNKYKIETLNDTKAVIEPAIVDFLVKNLDAVFEASDSQ